MYTCRLVRSCGNRASNTSLISGWEPAWVQSWTFQAEPMLPTMTYTTNFQTADDRKVQLLGAIQFGPVRSLGRLMTLILCHVWQVL